MSNGTTEQRHNGTKGREPFAERLVVLPCFRIPAKNPGLAFVVHCPLTPNRAHGERLMAS